MFPHHNFSLLPLFYYPSVPFFNILILFSFLWSLYLDNPSLLQIWFQFYPGSRMCGLIKASLRGHPGAQFESSVVGEDVDYGHCLENTLFRRWEQGLETREVGTEPAEYNHSSKNNSRNMVLSTSPVSFYKLEMVPNYLLNQINVLNHEFYGPPFGSTIPPHIFFPQQANQSSVSTSNLKHTFPPPPRKFIENNPSFLSPPLSKGPWYL